MEWWTPVTALALAGWLVTYALKVSCLKVMPFECVGKMKRGVAVNQLVKVCMYSSQVILLRY
jgi:hypothetical protein